MDNIVKKLELLKNRLCVSNKASLIRQLKVQEKQKFFDLSNLNLLDNTYSSNTDQIINNVIFDNKKTMLLHENEQNEDVIYYSYKFKKLHNEFKKLERTKGKKDLYIAYLFLEGYIRKGPKEEYIRAPLFLIPCELIKNQYKGIKWEISSSVKEEEILNYNLLKYLSTYSNVTLNEDVIKDVKKLSYKDNIKWTINKLKDLNIHVSNINDNEINEDTFKDNYVKISKFKDFKAHEVPTIKEFKGINIFKIRGYCVLGIYSKSSSALLNDYSNLLNKVKYGEELGLISELLMYSNENNQLEKECINVDCIKEENKLFITELDTSQEEAVLEIENNKAVIIHGPPGTGKSQVITSMISNSLAKGRKILMVCEKGTALKVIYDRLDLCGLSKYVAFIDQMNDTNKKKNLYCSIKDTMNSLKNNRLDSDLRHDLRNINEKIDEKTKYLNSIADNLHRTLAGNLTPYELYTNFKSTDKNYRGIFLGDISNRYTDDKLKNLKPKLIKLAKYYYKVNYDNVLKFRIKFNDFNISYRNEFINRIDKVIKNYEKIRCDKSFKQLIELLNKCNMEKDEFKKVICSVYERIRLDKTDLMHKIKRYFWMKFTSNSVLSKINIHEVNHLKTLNEIIKVYYDEIHKIDDIFTHIEELKIFLSTDGIKEVKNKLYIGEEINKELEEVREIISNDFEQIRDYDETLESLNDDEKYIYNKLKEKSFDNDKDVGIQWYNSLKQSLYRDWIDKNERDYPILKNATSQCNKYNIIINEYKTKIDEKNQLIPKVIQLKLLEEMEKSEEKCGGSLWKKVNRKRNLCSLRQLVKEFINKGLFNYKPLWLVSPDVAASIFPLEKGIFDLIIFDEASQLTVEHSIPLIYRAKKLVVAGDEKQLPPNNFNNEESEEFDNIEKNEEIEQLLSYKSLLELCNNVFYRNEKLLLWHYRSEYEELINFSNHAFYNGEIQISPNIIRGNENKAIEWIKVKEKAIYQGGKNEVEAEFLCDVLNNIFKEYKNKSIGIITFTKKQQECIEKVIEKRCIEDIEFKTMYDKAENAEELENRIFISNIDEIQGDERQIIIFSVGYAPREDGTFDGSITGNLNKKEGQYRLNVAISRAKSKIFVISSIEPEIMNEAKAEENRGRWLFKEYLEYCKAVFNNDTSQVKVILKRINQNTQRVDKEDNFDSPFEREVVSKLRDKKYIVDTQVGCSNYKIDMAIVHPNNSNRYILGIEADGATYHSARSAKERDIYRQKFLEMKGWKIERIWSRDWCINSDREIGNIDKKIKQILKEEE